MPFYDFENQTTKEVREVWIDQNKPVVFNGIDDKEVGLWLKIYSCPHMSVDTRYEAHSAKDFRKVTQNKKGLTVGDMWKKSAEFSAKRGGQTGDDEVKRRYYDTYEKATKTKRIPHAVENAKKGAKDLVKKLGL